MIPMCPISPIRCSALELFFEHSLPRRRLGVGGRTTKKAPRLPDGVSRDRPQILVVLQNRVFCQDAAEMSKWVDQGTAANDRAGADDRVATDLGFVADNGAELS